MFEVKLRPDTPVHIRRLIRKMEASKDRLEDWVCRTVTAIEVLTIIMLLLCVADYYG